MSYYSILVQKGHFFYQMDRQDSLLQYVRRVRGFLKGKSSTPATELLWAKVCNLEAATYHRKRVNNEQSLRLYQDALGHIMRSDNQDDAPNIAANLADAYVYLNNIPEAARYYRRALFLADSLGLPDDASVSLYMGLGQIYTTLEDYESALHFYQLTERKYDRMETGMKSYFLNNFGNFYFFRNDYANALRMFRRMRSLAVADGDSISLGYCNLNLAHTFLNLGQLDSAQACLDIAERSLAKQGVGDVVNWAHTIRLGLALKRKDYRAIERLLARDGNLETKDAGLLDIRGRYLAEYYAATWRYREAYAMVLVEKARNDSSEHKKQNMRASDIMSRFAEDTIRLHFALERKERNAEVAESKAAFYLSLLVLAVLVLGGATALMVHRRRKAQRDLDMFLLRLTTIRQRISPHFVFNVINAKMGNAPKEEADLLLSMAKLIRKNLELTGRTFVPLSEEMEFVGRYVSLQGSLMGGLDYVTRLPSEAVMAQITIPSMFVQILVENAIKHGLRNAAGVRRLTIDVEATDERTVISVADTGPGLDIRRRSKDSTRSGLSIIRGTMAVVNKNNKRNARMSFDIGNTYDAAGAVTGCKATLTVPRAMRPI